MTRVLVLVATAALAALAWWLVRRAPAREATDRHIAGIALLVAAQAILMYAFAVGVFPPLWGGGEGGLPGLVTLVQAGRAALLILAARLWYAISRNELAQGGRLAWLALAVLSALGSGTTSVLALAVLVWFSAVRSGRGSSPDGVGARCSSPVRCCSRSPACGHDRWWTARA